MWRQIALHGEPAGQRRILGGQLSRAGTVLSAELVENHMAALSQEHRVAASRATACTVCANDAGDATSDGYHIGLPRNCGGPLRDRHTRPRGRGVHHDKLAWVVVFAQVPAVAGGSEDQLRVSAASVVTTLRAG